MILYNVTVNVEKSIEQAWLKWIKTEHMLDMINTGMFRSARIFRLLNVEQSEGTSTYAVQYYADTMEQFETYEKKYADTLRAEAQHKFGTRTVSFRTLMEEV